MKSVVEERGKLPSIRSIHENSYAWHHTSVDDVNRLLAVTPCTLGGAYHWLPLMYAARNGASGAVIRRLIMEQPHAVRIPDCDGWLPIHYSSYTGNSEACVVLLESWPNSIYALTQANSGEFGDRYKGLTSKTPLQLAKEQSMWPAVTALKNFIKKFDSIKLIKLRKYKRWNGFQVYQKMPWFAPPRVVSEISYANPPPNKKAYLREIFYCTNRPPASMNDRVAADCMHYSNNRSEPNAEAASKNGFMNYGRIQVAFPAREINDIVSKWQSETILEITELNVDLREPAKVFFGEYNNFKDQGTSDIIKSLKEYSSILLYVPGTNTSFWDGILAASTIADDLGFEGTVCTYSWPSYKDVSKYQADVSAAHSSSVKLASYISNLITVLADAKSMHESSLKGKYKIHLCSHSLGSSCLLDALMIVSMCDGERAKKYIGNIAMLLPDIDLEDYNQKMRLAQRIIDKTVIYSNRKAHYLTVSSQHHIHTRLGACPTGYVNVMFGDVIHCGKFYDDYIPGSTTGKFSKLANDRLCTEMRSLISHSLP